MFNNLHTDALSHTASGLQQTGNCVSASQGSS